MTRGCFTFDASRCVGCQACMVACRLTNRDLSRLPWRVVWKFNAFQHPSLPVFNLSLACNHCSSAPCLAGCPARAYSVDNQSMTIQHDPKKCMGCQYCTWICPYAAPKMNNNTGVIEKCTFCLVRTREGMLPSCAQSCPTGALGYKNGEPGVNDFPGFPETGTAPSIQIIRTNERRSPIGRILLPPEEESLFNKTTTRLKPSRQWGHDLPLVIFTVLAAILTSLTTAMVLGAYRVSPWHFLLPGLTGMVVSLMHLGKKFRAWRSVSNLKTSWLSREILSFGLLLFFGMTGLIFHESRLALPAAAISGIFCLVSIDMLYRKIPRPEPERKNSSGLLIFTWPLFVALFLDLTVVAAFILLIRAIFYLRKHWRYRTLMTRTNIAGLTFRITAGFLIPWILMLLFPFEHAKLWILLLVTMGELADRFEFYSEISVLSPEEIYHSMLISQQGDQ